MTIINRQMYPLQTSMSLINKMTDQFGVLQNQLATGQKASTLADLSGKRVGVARGSVYAKILAAANVPGMEIIQFADDSANLNALAAGQVDAAGTVSFLAAELNKRYPDKKFEPKVTLTNNVYAMGVRRGDFDFQHWINTFIYVNILNGNIPKAYEKWMGDPWKTLPPFY